MKNKNDVVYRRCGHIQCVVVHASVSLPAVSSGGPPPPLVSTLQSGAAKLVYMC